MSRTADRLLAILLLCPSCLEPPEEALEEDGGSSEDDGASEDGGSSGELDEPFADELIDPATSEVRESHRSRLAVGAGFACAIVPDGTVRCWGSNDDGALGNGTYIDSSTPVPVSGLQDVISVNASRATVFALRSNGTVYAWGARIDGQGSDTTPRLVAGLSDIVSIGARNHVACAVRVDGRTFCWGIGPLGDGAEPINLPIATPTQVLGVTTAVATTGECVLLANGTVKCWGGNSNGELGDGTFADSYAPVSVQGIGTAVQIETSAFNSYATLADGTLWSWGQNQDGQLGVGETGPDVAIPVQVDGIQNARDIAAGRDMHSFACAALDDGTARCWGATYEGALGTGSVNEFPHPDPEAVVGLDGVVEIDANGGSVCASRMDGSVRCWGDNGRGQLGDGTTIDRPTPVDVVGLSTVNDGPRVAVGMYHSCGLRTDGTVKCWGDNSQGQLGDGTLTDRTSATVVSGLSGAIDIEAGGHHSCALMADGTARCWGSNAAGELGDGGASGIRSSSPVVVEGVDDATKIAAAQESTCAIRSNGTVVCWGDNDYGQLGDGTFTSSDAPVAVSGLTNAVDIDATRYHVCALGSGGQIRCWGANATGQLGDGSTTNSNVPVTVRSAGLTHPVLNNVVDVATGYFHSCAAFSSGALRCWGSGTSGALGHGAWTNSNYAVAVANITTGMAVSTGGSSSCALRSNGTGRCWGSGSYGQLGNGDDDATNTPVAVGMNPIFLSNAMGIDSGYNHTCVAKGNGTIACWGRNNNGQLGNGSTFDADLPVAVASFP